MAFGFVASALVIAGALIVISYAMWLLTGQRISPSSKNESPPVLIVVPVFDEASLIEGKLVNLARLTYPRRRVVIVDGGSTDGTLEIVQRAEGVHVLRTEHRNKTLQINAAVVAFRDEELILVTDADAMLAPDAIESLLDAFSSEVGVAGTRILPHAAHALEAVHWRIANWLREKETRRGSAAIVAAPCYLVRRELLVDLPHDTVADDVHVACRAMLAGYRVALAETTVHELRSPHRLTSFLRHKHRKADAYLREIFRFLPVARRMSPPMRTIFLFRAALLTVVPLLWTAAGVALLLSRPAATGAFVLMALIAAIGRNAARLVALLALLAGVLSITLLRYPLSRQTASFPKVR